MKNEDIKIILQIHLAELIDISFIDDDEKMNDFHILTKDEFLKSYSYLDEFEYDVTGTILSIKEVLRLFMENRRMKNV